MFQCQNERCSSHETNFPFATTEKSRALAINRALFLGFRAIGGSQATASKVGTVVRALAQSDPGSNPAWCHMCVEFVVGKGFPAGFLVSILPQNQLSKFQFKQDRGPA